MKAINLKDYYPYYTQDMYIEVSDELAQLLEHFERKEANYQRKKYRYALDNA